MKGFGLDTVNSIRYKANKRSKNKYFCMSRKFLINNKKAGVLRSWMSSISFPSGVEFTNSYQDHVNSTSHFDAHFSGFWLIIDAYLIKNHLFQN